MLLLSAEKMHQNTSLLFRLMASAWSDLTDLITTQGLKDLDKLFKKKKMCYGVGKNIDVTVFAMSTKLFIPSTTTKCVMGLEKI